MPGMLARWLPVWPPYFISWTPVLKPSIGAGNPKVTPELVQFFMDGKLHLLLIFVGIFASYILVGRIVIHCNWDWQESSTESTVFIQRNTSQAKSDPKKSPKQRRQRQKRESQGFIELRAKHLELPCANPEESGSGVTWFGVMMLSF